MASQSRTSSVQVHDFKKETSKKEIMEELQKMNSEKEIREYASEVFGNGGYNQNQFKGTNNGEKVALFIKKYNDIKQSTAWKECQKKYAEIMKSIKNELLKFIFDKIIEFSANEKSKIIFYGSSVFHFFPDAPYKVESYEPGDIDVATENSDISRKLATYVYEKLIILGSEKTYSSGITMKKITLRFKSHGVGTITIEFRDSCKEKHYIGKLDLVDIGIKNSTLEKSLPIRDIIKSPSENLQKVIDFISIQNPVSFLIGSYDKLAAVETNVNKLRQDQQQKSREKLEGRIKNLKISYSISKEDVDFFRDKFSHLTNCQKVEQMFNEKLTDFF